MRGLQVRDAGHDQLPGAGKGSNMRKNDIERLFLMLLGEGLLAETSKQNKMGFSASYLVVSNLVL